MAPTIAVWKFADPSNCEDYRRKLSNHLESVDFDNACDAEAKT